MDATPTERFTDSLGQEAVLEIDTTMVLVSNCSRKAAGSEGPTGGVRMFTQKFQLPTSRHRDLCQRVCELPSSG